MTPVKRRYSKEEFARRGDEVYGKHIQPLLTPKDNGKLVAVDIETGEFEIDDDEMKACHRLRARLPNAQTWIVRVGYPYVHRFGGRGVRRKS